MITDNWLGRVLCQVPESESELHCAAVILILILILLDVLTRPVPQVLSVLAQASMQSLPALVAEALVE